MNRNKITLASFAVIAALALGSCSDDSSGPASIIGKWSYVKTITQVGSNNPTSVTYPGHEQGCDKDYQEFTETPVFRDVVWYQDGDDVCTEDVDFGTYAKEDDQLTIDFDGDGADAPETFTITKLKGSELRYASTTETGGVTLTVTKVFRKQ